MKVDFSDCPNGYNEDNVSKKFCVNDSESEVCMNQCANFVSSSGIYTCKKLLEINKK